MVTREQLLIHSCDKMTLGESLPGNTLRLFMALSQSYGRTLDPGDPRECFICEWMNGGMDGWTDEKAQNQYGDPSAEIMFAHE